VKPSLLLLYLLAAPLFAAVPRACTGSLTLGTFRVSVVPPKGGAPLPLKAVSRIPAGSRLVWEPASASPKSKDKSDKAEVAGIVVPAPEGDLVVLEPRKADAHAEWPLPDTPGVVAIILGPHGLSMGKVKSLVTRNRELLTQLADYAEQTSEVEALIQRIADSEQTGGGADAALKGFSSQYGVAIPKLDSQASTSAQASVLLRALLPSANTYDPLAPKSTQLQQSAGLAASVASLFFGNSVSLAAGGTALLANLKTALFPSTDFRSAFGQNSGKDAMALCAKQETAKSRTRMAYLWAQRVPNLDPPAVALAGPAHLPLGSKSLLKLAHAQEPKSGHLDRVREWRLVPVSGAKAAPVPVTIPGAADTIEVDLSKASVPPGEYRLSGMWDWQSITVSGPLHLHPYGDFSKVKITPETRDRLVEGNGVVTVKLTGTDFEFVEKAAIEKVERKRLPNPPETTFTLPLGKREGEQDSMLAEIDTAAPGPYRLLITQSDGLTHEVPLTVLPPNPKPANLPVRVNLGETRQAIRIEGSGVERIEGLSSPAGEISGKVEGSSWQGEIKLKPDAARGQLYPLSMKVKGLDGPVSVADAIRVVGPRPKIVSIRKSNPGELGIALREDELPTGTAVGLVLSVEHVDDAENRPVVELGCKSGDLRKPAVLTPPSSGAGSLYISADPGAVGYAGCVLTATVAVEPEGRSDPYALGRVVRIPRLEQFTLTGEQVAPSVYAGILKGRDLDLVEKTGWDASHGVAVDSIPAPVPGDPLRQTLRVALPWPAPAPHAPLYVWIRGESEGRKTTVAE
jgi:hypothetical protein